MSPSTSTGDVDGPSPDALRAALIGPARIEVVPGGTVVDDVRRLLPAGRTLTVTCLPKHGPDLAVDTAVALAGAGYGAIPHLAAHAVTGRSHLAELVGRAAAAGIDEYLVIGGDGHVLAGAYPWAGALLADLLELAGPGTRVAVAGYPEPHPTHAREELLDALAAKQALGASSIVTQMCFHPAAIPGWLDELARRGIDLPVSLGIPGRVRSARLVELSARIGVAGSLRFLRGQRGLLRLLAHREFRPDGWIDELLRQPGLRTDRLTGLHVYSFNQLERTAAWLARAGG